MWMDCIQLTVSSLSAGLVLEDGGVDATGQRVDLGGAVACDLPVLQEGVNVYALSIKVSGSSESAGLPVYNEVTVEMVTGKQYKCQVRPEATLAELKLLTQKSLGLSTSCLQFVMINTIKRQMMYLKDKVNTLANHGVEDVTTLHLILRLRGGGPGGGSYAPESHEGQSAKTAHHTCLVLADTLRLSVHTGGSKTKLRGDGEDEEAVARTLLMHRGNTRSVGLDEAGGSSRGRVRPWHDEDVMLFLSNDGDSDPIYLWRERLAAHAPSSGAPTDANMIDVPGATEPVNAALTATNDSAEAEESGIAEEPGIAAIKALFVHGGMRALCVDVYDTSTHTHNSELTVLTIYRLSLLNILMNCPTT